MDRRATSAIASSTFASTFRRSRWVRSASPWCGNVTITRRPCFTIEASSFSASASPRAAIAGTLRLEHVRLRARERVEARDAVEARSLDRLLVPEAQRRRRSARRGREGRRGAGRGPCRRLPSSSSASSGTRSRAGIDHRFGDRVERSLRERREGADLLDVVPEELDAKRLASRAREDVDEPAAHGDLPALLHALDALVAGERELFDERVEVARVGRREADHVGSRRAREACPRRARGPRRTRARPQRAPRERGLARPRGERAARGRRPRRHLGSAGARPSQGRRTTRPPRRRRAPPRPRPAGT